MRFHLIYDGPLTATQGDPRSGQPVPKARQKQEIRKQFHKQLKELWKTKNFLRDTKILNNTQVAVPIERDIGGTWGYGGTHPPGSERPLVDYVADQHSHFDYKFVPIAREAWSLACGLEILFLRCDPPGGVYTAGDVDNRIKTLLDGMRMPKSVAELGGYTVPDADESPFFCLLEDDKSITSLAVNTDTLLSPITASDPSWAHIVITVDIRPYVVTTFNLALA